MLPVDTIAHLWNIPDWQFRLEEQIFDWNQIDDPPTIITFTVLDKLPFPKNVCYMSYVTEPILPPLKQNLIQKIAKHTALVITKQLRVCNWCNINRACETHYSQKYHHQTEKEGLLSVATLLEHSRNSWRSLCTYIH
jgi:hypothetical protein